MPCKFSKNELKERCNDDGRSTNDHHPPSVLESIRQARHGEEMLPLPLLRRGNLFPHDANDDDEIEEFCSPICADKKKKIDE